MHPQAQDRDQDASSWTRSNVVGVGNIYASEACFRARCPAAPSGVDSLTRAECEALAHVDPGRPAARRSDAGGTTLRDYVGVDEGTGYFQRELSVYDRAGEPCHACATPIKHLVTGQRSTYYCPTCQR